jgi:MGT family glycosyltransferase
VNGAFGLEYARAIPPLVSMVGPMLPASAPDLSEDMAEWLSAGPPVVYVNLGTLAVATTELLARMSAALDSDRFRTLWVVPREQALRLPSPRPSTLRVLDWGPPPLAVLSHPNVKVFVSHCGVNSAYEAMQAGTPIVGIPICADQRDMAVRVADAGAGLWLDKARFTAAELRGAIERVLDEPSFTEGTRPIQAAIRDSGGVVRAADLIEAEARIAWTPRETSCA